MIPTSVWFISAPFPSRISDSSYSPLPFFLFGDFNFRLDTLSLVQVGHDPCTGCFVAGEDQLMRKNVPQCSLDTNRVLVCHEQHLSTSADVQTVKKDSSNEVEKIICEEKDNDHKVIENASPQGSKTLCCLGRWRLCSCYCFARRCCCILRPSCLPTCTRQSSGRITAKQWEHNLNFHPLWSDQLHHSLWQEVFLL